VSRGLGDVYKRQEEEEDEGPRGRIELGEVLHGAKTAIFAHVVKKIAVFVCFKA
jgi:hypothetical protein